MPSFYLHQGFAAQQIRSNPWKQNQYIISSSQHFGVVGSGKVYIVEATPGFAPGSPVRAIGCWGTPDGIFDACFSEMDANIVVCACGDGVKVFNMAQSLNVNGAAPLLHNMEHQQEVSCVVWHSAKRDSFFSSSWDTTIKQYSVVNPQQSIATFVGHMKEVYEVATTPRSPSSFLSCSGDATWKLWDARAPQAPVLSQFGHQNQIVLSVDFNKFDPNIFVTGGVDRTARVWDARRPNQPLVSLPGHDQACRRVRFSPHTKTMFASGGYDMRVCVWDLANPQKPMVARYQHHKEFVLGLEWSTSSPNNIATASFDGSCFFIPVGQQPTPSPPQQLPAAAPPPRQILPRKKVLPGLPQPMPQLPRPGTPPR